MSHPATKAFEIISPGSLLITGDRIAGIFDASIPVPDLPIGTEIIPCQGKIISPGFIDTHRHGWQTAFRSLAANTTMPEYLGRYGQYASQGNFTAEDIYIGQLAGLYECINAGVTTSIDNAHHTWDFETSKAGLEASIDSGLRVYWCYTFHDLPNGFTHSQQLACAASLLKDDRLKTYPTEVGVEYDGWYTDSDEKIKTIVDFTIQNEIPVLTTHSLGGPWILDNGPVVLNKHGILKTLVPVIISHASFMSSEDISLLRESNQYVSITPESEMHFGQDNEHSHKIMDQCALGVDTHFAFSTDIVTQARLWLQATRRALYREKLATNQIGHTSPFHVEQAFYLATVSGGLALRRDDLGVIKIGAKADLVVFDGESPNMLGFLDPIAAIILHSNVGDIEHVLVDGKWRKRDRKLLPSVTGKTWDTLKSEFASNARRIQKKWAGKPLPVVKDKFAGITPYATIDKVNIRRL
ncbi:hypothetical protein FOYG_08978 [Fusarium oxysporum NRRL 32931]|uniref:Amidohydrolase-related domain-containing protein n=1 Tax=Fusarium oxysporum NRRL 32931 TaxID=660029 RepID=W9IAY0_FUSOX|nr:hypothetical protein FOYG_08978 [Fusarium oxysporum NRRL 32931]